MKEDLTALGLLLLGLAAIVCITLVFVIFASYLCAVAWRLGLVSLAAQTTLFMVSLCMAGGTTLTLGARLVEGRWWFR